jgi:tetrahydromethanopterin S-methyltransferase subunit A
MINAENLKEEIIKRAQTIPEFKNKLISNPKDTIKDTIGKLYPNDPEVVIDDEINIRVVEETEKTFYIVIPYQPGEVGCW